MESSGSRILARRGWRVALSAAACLCSLAGLIGCGGSDKAGAGRVVNVVERDFKISTAATPIASGSVTLRVHNRGPDQHELIVVPKRQGGEPLRTDNFTVDEEALQSSEPGSLDPGRPGVTRYLKVNLKPGRYLLFCNMAGHYMAGMHTELVVS